MSTSPLQYTNEYQSRNDLDNVEELHRRVIQVAVENHAFMDVTIPLHDCMECYIPLERCKVTNVPFTVDNIEQTVAVLEETIEMEDSLDDIHDEAELFRRFEQLCDEIAAYRRVIDTAIERCSSPIDELEVTLNFEERGSIVDMDDPDAFNSVTLYSPSP